jgi:hypothetical protein
MTIGHKEGDAVFVDAVRERRPPFSPEDVVAEFSALRKLQRGRYCAPHQAGLK